MGGTAGMEDMSIGFGTDDERVWLGGRSRAIASSVWGTAEWDCARRILLAAPLPLAELVAERLLRERWYGGREPAGTRETEKG